MSSNRLKFLALLFMVTDHIALFIPFIPEWFHWVGRLSAPIFFFCMAWGFYFTKDKERYLIRMFTFGVVMCGLNYAISSFRAFSYPVTIHNNIFSTMFASCCIIYLIELLRNQPQKGKKYLLFYLIWQTFSTIVIVALGFSNYYYIESDFYGIVFGNVFINGGSFPFVILGVLFYYVKNSRKHIVISYITFSFFYSFFYHTNAVARIFIKLEAIFPDWIIMVGKGICGVLGISIQPISGIKFYELTSYYWMIVFSLPFILLYNGKRGKGNKYFFYFFYPLHIYVLYIIGNFLYMYK